MIREKIREGKEAVGRKLIDVPGYTFRMWVTDRTQSPEELWREYNGRATIEQRIEELKNDPGADEFCTQNFWATESAFLAELSPEISVSIMSQYSPQYKACGIPELNRPLTAEEYDEITDYALELGLENAFIQTLESQETYLPDFDKPAPFTG